MRVADTAFEIWGESKTFSRPGDSGNPVVRRFCPECGSSISEQASTSPGLVIINAGTLDDPTTVTPTIQIYCDRELRWVQLSGGMDRFAKLPA
jgi:hypothetical protein